MSAILPIGGRTFSVEHALIVGEVAQAHDGSLGIAHAFIDAIADAGADAVKFQTHIAAAESTPAEPWRVQFSRAGRDALRLLAAHGILGARSGPGSSSTPTSAACSFLSSPFSVEAVELLAPHRRAGLEDRLGRDGQPSAARPPARNGPAGPALDRDEPDRRDRRGRPARAVACRCRSAVLQCTSAYPCPPEKVGLEPASPFFRERYGCAVGLSDHSGTIYPGLAAAAARHRRCSRCTSRSAGRCSGRTSRRRSRPTELRQLVDGNPLHRADARAPRRQGRASRPSSRRCARSSPRAWSRALRFRPARSCGDEHLAAKKPGTGIPAARLPELIGGAACRRDLSRRRDRPRPKIWKKTDDAAQGLRRRHGAPELQPDQDGPPRRSRAIPISSSSSWSAPRRCSTATARAVRYDRGRRLHDRRPRLHGARGREPRGDGQDDRSRPARARHGLRQPRTGRGGHDRRPLRDAGHRRRRLLHEHPVAHVQGGEITGSIDEKVRHAVTKLSNLHFVSTELAAERLIRMGEDPATVFVTGCPSIDLAAEVHEAPGARLRPVRQVRRRGRLGGPVRAATWSSCSTRSRPSTSWRRQQVLETLCAVAGDRPADSVVLAERRRGLRRDLQRHPGLPRKRASRPTSTSSRTWRRPISCASSTTAAAWSGTRASASASARTWAYRSSTSERASSGASGATTSSTSVYDRREIIDAVRRQIANGRYPGEALYGGGSAGVRDRRSSRRAAPGDREDGCTTR